MKDAALDKALSRVAVGLLTKPSLYLSDFFERNRASYYDALMAVRFPMT